MAGATYICQLGCPMDCRHGLPCEVFGVDKAHPHPKRHFSVDDDGNIHEWRGDKGYGRCEITLVDPPEVEDM